MAIVVAASGVLGGARSALAEEAAPAESGLQLRLSGQFEVGLADLPNGNLSFMPVGLSAQLGIRFNRLLSVYLSPHLQFAMSNDLSGDLDLGGDLGCGLFGELSVGEHVFVAVGVDSDAILYLSEGDGLMTGGAAQLGFKQRWGGADASPSFAEIGVEGRYLFGSWATPHGFTDTKAPGQVFIGVLFVGYQFF
jgi:hypothetical protein